VFTLFDRICPLYILSLEKWVGNDAYPFFCDAGIQKYGDYGILWQGVDVFPACPIIYLGREIPTQFDP
jgi:hypothetical protein